MDSILDTESIPADGRGIEQIRIKPGVYQKTPEYQLAERDYYRFVNNRFEIPRWRVVSVKTLGRKIDFVGNCITELTAYFSLFFHAFIFTPLNENLVKNSIMFTRKFKKNANKNYMVFTETIRQRKQYLARQRVFHGINYTFLHMNILKKHYNILYESYII